MNPNTRKRHDALPRCEQVPSTRKPTPKSTVSDKNRLFDPKNTIKESDNMTRINYPEFKAYRDSTTRIRVPNARHHAPRICMPDGFTIQITRKRAARYLRDMRTADKKLRGATVTAVVIESGVREHEARVARKDTRKAFDARLKSAAKRAATNGVPSDNTTPKGNSTDLASRLWASWMTTRRKLTFEQYCARWLADNTA